MSLLRLLYTYLSLFAKISVIWSNGRDLNPRFYGFAIRCIGPLCHRCIFIRKELGEFWSTKKSDLATRGIQSRSTCLANMEYHMRSKIAQTVCPDLPPGWSMIYNHQILKASDPLYFLKDSRYSKFLTDKNWLRGLDLNQGWQWLMRPRW